MPLSLSLSFSGSHVTQRLNQSLSSHSFFFSLFLPSVFLLFFPPSFSNLPFYVAQTGLKCLGDPLRRLPNPGIRGECLHMQPCISLINLPVDVWVSVMNLEMSDYRNTFPLWHNSPEVFSGVLDSPTMLFVKAHGRSKESKDAKPSHHRCMWPVGAGWSQAVSRSQNWFPGAAPVHLWATMSGVLRMPLILKYIEVF